MRLAHATSIAHRFPGIQELLPELDDRWTNYVSPEQEQQIQQKEDLDGEVAMASLPEGDEDPEDPDAS